VEDLKCVNLKLEFHCILLQFLYDLLRYLHIGTSMLIDTYVIEIDISDFYIN
jgi:hypothetical protein